MRKFLVAACLGYAAILNGNAYAQNKTLCGNEVIEEQIAKDPVLKAKFDAYRAQYAEENKVMMEQEARSASKTTAGSFMIPVVFHVVLSQDQLNDLGGTAGVHARIIEQIAVLNEDFNAANADLSTIPDAFKPLIGNADISFGIAKTNPSGKGQYGVNFINKPSTFTGYDQNDFSLKRSAQGGASPWDNTRYINVWITKITTQSQGGQILGYAYNPVYAANVYGDGALGGAVIHYLTLGRRTGIGQQFYSPKAEKGRTLTHELGHFFNIWHIWGAKSSVIDTTCSNADDDGISDTPLQGKATQDCPTPFNVKIDNCKNAPHPGGVMYQNFMDYTGDPCTRMFTKEQVTRMRKEIVAGGQTPSLGSNPHLTEYPLDIPAMEYNNKFDLYPNPSSGVFNIYFTDKYNQLDNITISNVMGQTVKQIAIADQVKLDYKVDITDMPKGMYVVHLHFDQGIVSRKVVIE